MSMMTRDGELRDGTMEMDADGRMNEERGIEQGNEEQGHDHKP